MVTDTQKEALYVCARDAYAQGESMLKSFSGADQADSELYILARAFYVDVADGAPIDAALDRQEARWRQYAAGQKAKVDAAPKIKRGPMQGHSAISHRWVDPERFKHHRNHLNFMATRILASP